MPKQILSSFCLQKRLFQAENQAETDAFRSVIPDELRLNVCALALDLTFRTGKFKWKYAQNRPLNTLIYALDRVENNAF